MKHVKFRRVHTVFVSVALFACLILFMAFPFVAWAQNPPGVGGNAVSEETTLPAAPLPVAPTTAPGNVSIDFKDADIANVLRILSLKSQVNIVAGPEVAGTVTIRLEDVPWEKALDVVLRTYGYVYEREGNIIRVTTKDNLATEELVTETFILNYTTAAEAEAAIKDILSERGRIKSVPRTNMLVVTDIPTNLYKIREVIAKLDKATPQAHIDSKIIETQLQVGENLGIQWSPAGTLSGAQKPITFPFNSFAKSDEADPFERIFSKFFPNQGTALAVNPNNPSGFATPSVAAPGSNTYTLGTLNFTSFSAVLQFLRTRGNTRIVSNPRITVLNNQKARIKVGTDVALPQFERNETTGSFEISGYEYRETGVVMEVTPHINDADEILVDLKPEVSSQSGSTSFSSSTTASFTSIPNFAVTNAETQVLIKNGETIAIGGLMTDSMVTTEQKVPIFGDIPLVGKLFRSKDRDSGTNNQKKETLFFITVTIVDTEGEPTTILVRRGASASVPPAVGGAQAPLTEPKLTAQDGHVENV